VSEIVAHHIFTGEPVRLRWNQEGIITSLDAARSAPPELWMGPGLFDIQVNGYAGVDFQQDNVTASELTHAVLQLRESGCTRFLLTLVSDEWDRLLSRLKHFRKLRAASPLLQRAIAGWHIEGPFLSSEPGFCGAHSPERMLDPKLEQLDELRKIAGDDPLLLTMAPERLDSIPAIAHAVSLGIKVSLGHTDARRKRLEQAVKAGATGFTHLGNGCPSQLSRADNILWRVFETPGLTISLIPDTIHVSPALFRLIHKTIGAENILYVTDAMAAAGAGPGKYKLGPLELEVGTDQIVRLPGSANFAGSALEPLDAVLRAAEMLRCSWRETWRNYSATPAKFIGIDHDLRPGAPADFCLVEFAEPNQIIKLKTFVAGSDAA